MWRYCDCICWVSAASSLAAVYVEQIPRGKQLASIALLMHEALSWSFRDAMLWPWLPTPPTDEKLPFNITVVFGKPVSQEWLDGSSRVHGEGGVAVVDTKDSFPERSPDRSRDRSPGTPLAWDSRSCMVQWGMPELLNEIDPAGYIVFSEGREQLGNNRFLLSDGLVIAKALQRTLVEFPMANSRIAKPDASLGVCDYWDCKKLCAYHRILDLWTFRAMLRDGRIDLESFVSVVSGEWEQSLLLDLATPENITDFFQEYQDKQVIVMNMAWKSGLRREPLDLIRPNPFYRDKVRSLLESQKGWETGEYMAVQWRTETSTGNLTDCYHRYVKTAVEETRLRLGFQTDQIYFNTDLVGQASTTYNSSVVQANRGVVEAIEADYPSAMNNTVYHLLRGEQDAGVRAMVSGLVSASSRVLLSSSFNGSGSNECQKPHSKYIDLVAEWRLEIFDNDNDDGFNGERKHDDSGSVVRLFPEDDQDDSYQEPTKRTFFVGFAATTTVVVGVGILVVVANVLILRKVGGGFWSTLSRLLRFRERGMLTTSGAISSDGALLARPPKDHAL